MVEELKLAIKIDDASIEQSLLKQFANAQKMADKVVLDFKNVNFDDKQIEAKFKEMQKKAGQNPIDFSISGNTLDMLGQIDKRLTEIFSIGKGKSFIDSSSITADIDKIENKINELNKKINTSFDTKNKTEAYNQLKKYADAFKDYYNNEEAMASESGTKAAYAYYKAYEEALKKEVAQSKLEKVTVDFDINDKFFDKNRIVSDRIKEYANYKKYGNDNDLLEEISSLKNKLFDFNSAYSQVKEKLGQAAITPEIIKSVERYVELLDKARFLEQFNDPDDNGTIKSHRAMAQASLDNALFNAQEQSYKYTKSLRQQEEQLTSTVEAEQKLAEVQKETTSNSVTSDNSQIEELKSDIQEVKTELGDVKDRISSIESNGFENVREDVEKTKESVKELNSELTEMKSNLSSAPQESNISSGMKDAFPNVDTKLDEAVTSAKDLDKTLEQVDIPTDSFDKVLEKLDRTKSELVDIVKITKQSVSDADGKFHDSYTLKDSRGSTEIYGVNSKTDKGQILRQNIVGYDKKKDELDISKAQLEVDKQLAKEEDNLAKAQQKKAQAFLKEQANYEEDQKKAELIKRQTLAYEELTDTISKYSEVAKRVAGGNADDGDLELMTKLEDKISQLQKQPILSDSQVSKSEKSLVSLYDQLDKIERKLVETNQKSQDKQIAGFDKRLESYTKKTSGYNATIARFNDGGWTSDIYLKNVQAVKDAVKQYEDLLSDIKAKGGIASEDDIQKLKEYESEIKNTIATVTNMSAAEKGYNFVSGQKELDKIHKLLNENSKMSSEAKAKIRAYYAEIESGNPSMSLDKIHGEILKIYNAEVEAGRAGRTLWDTLKNSGFHQIAAQMAGMVGVYDVINLGKEGFNVVRELNTALTEMRKVSDESLQSLKNYQNTTFDTADAVGTTAKQIQNSTADWMRLGESMNQAAESAKDANVLLNVSEFEGIDEATESLVSMSQAYKDLDKMDIIDVLNNIGNNYSISTDGLATALKDSASALVTANNDLNEAVSLTTAGNAITQDPSKVGAGLRTISLRLVGTEEAKQELSDLGEETDGMITTVSKLRDTIMDATKAASSDGKGFDILDSNGNYKSTYEIMQGLADLYDDIVKKDKELGTNNLNLLLETIAGKNRSNIAASILQNGDMLRSVYEDAQNSEGSAQKELNSRLDSIDGKMAQLENRAQEFWFKVIDSKTIKNGIDLLSTLLKGVTDFVDTVGLLPTILTGVGAALSFKNVGILELN